MVRWPRGTIAAKGKDGMAKTVKETLFSIGYTEYLYALQYSVSYGMIKNHAGRFVLPDVESVSAAAQEIAAATEAPEELAAGLLSAQNVRAYPLASVSFLLVPTHLTDEQTRKVLREFLHWILTAGQPLAKGMGYVALPPNLLQRELNLLNRINF